MRIQQSVGRAFDLTGMNRVLCTVLLGAGVFIVTLLVTGIVLGSSTSAAVVAAAAASSLTFMSCGYACLAFSDLQIARRRQSCEDALPGAIAALAAAKAERGQRRSAERQRRRAEREQRSAERKQRHAECAQPAEADACPSACAPHQARNRSRRARGEVTNLLLKGVALGISVPIGVTAAVVIRSVVFPEAHGALPGGAAIFSILVTYNALKSAFGVE
jgi:hypothetical protein